jgi:putative ABC transport system ATP-binding protein
MTKIDDNQIIRLIEVSKRYPLANGTFCNAINKITLTIGNGQFVSIMGPSGSGKSTLMHIIGALDNISSGTYIFKGKNISSYSQDELSKIRNKEIGFVFQSFNLLPRSTVFHNVERPMVYGGINKSDRERRVIEALELVGIKDKAENMSNQLSGGETQRVAIARAIIMNPSIILADEPTGNLDSKTSRDIMNLLNNLHEKGSTVAVITHDINIAKYTHRRINILDGQIVSDVGTGISS